MPRGISKSGLRRISKKERIANWRRNEANRAIAKAKIKNSSHLIKTATVRVEQH